MKTQKEPWPKKSYEKVTLELKLFVVDQIQNGQISTNFASKKYDVPRTGPIPLQYLTLIKKLLHKLLMKDINKI